MNVRKVLVIVMLSMFVCSLPVWADDAYTYFQAKKVTVSVNSVDTNEQGLLTQEGKVLLPLRDIAGTLQAMVQWDDKKQKVNIYKPNVHVFPISFVDNEIVPFANVFKGKNEFRLWAQVDSLQTQIAAVKLSITDPNGANVYNYVLEYTEDKPSTEEFWLTTKQISLDFQTLGKYTIQVYMKTDKDSDYELVAERVIRCIPEKGK